MRRLLLIIGLLVALSGLIRSVDAQTTVVGYGSNVSGEIHLIDLNNASSISSFSTGIVFQGLAIDPTGTTLYGSDQNGFLYGIDIASETTTLIGNMELGTVEAMDFNFNGTELWVTDFDNFPTVTIYSIDTSDASATLVQTFHPPGFVNDTVRAMTANTTKDVWVAVDNFPSMDFLSIDTDISPPVTNVDRIGSLDDDPSAPFPVVRPKISGMDRGIDEVLYGLDNMGGVYIIDQTHDLDSKHPDGLDPATDARLSIIGNTGGHDWLGLAIATASLPEPSEPGDDPLNAVCGIKVGRENNCYNDNTGSRVAKSMLLETYNTDPELVNIWNSLFGVDPDDPVASPDGVLTLQGPNRAVTWEAGTLEMGGVMILRVKTNSRNPALKNVSIEKSGMHCGTTLFISGTGGVNPNLADGGWHPVVIRGLDNVTVTFDGYTITGFLRELIVKLDQGGTTGSPVVKAFKLKINGVTDSPNVCKTHVNSVVIDAPQTVVTAIAGTEYDEKVKVNPVVLSGHTEAVFEREPGAGIEGVDISSLLDDNNDKLRVRKGPCAIDDAAAGN